MKSKFISEREMWLKMVDAGLVQHDLSPEHLERVRYPIGNILYNESCNQVNVCKRQNIICKGNLPLLKIDDERGIINRQCLGSGNRFSSLS